MKKTVYLYVLDTMADWETAYLCAELNSGRYFKKGITPSKVVTVGMNKTPVTTMGGLKIVPDLDVESVQVKDVAVLILPGGDTWIEPSHEPILKKAAQCVQAGVIVGAICGATLGLAKSGILDHEWHTSNDLAF